MSSETLTFGAAWRYARFGWRDSQLRLLALAVFLACVATTLLGFFADRLERGVTAQSQRYLGAPLVIRSSREAPQVWWDEASRLGLPAPLEITDFISMASTGDQFALAGVKAVPAGYPLHGQLTLRDAEGKVSEVSSGPAPGEVFAAPRLLAMLGVKPGDTLQLGYSTFTITATLLQEPDPGISLVDINPRLMMNSADLAAAKVIQPGSRVSYRYLVDGPDTAISQFHQWLETKLDASARILDPASENQRLGRTLTRIHQYLDLGSVLAVLLAGIALSLAARQYSVRHQDELALWRCLGLGRKELALMLGMRLGVLLVAALVAGIAVGAVAQQGLVMLFRQWLPDPLPPVSWWPALNGVFTAVLLVAALVIPHWWQLLNISPLRTLRDDVMMPPVRRVLWIASALIALLLWLWGQSSSPKLTLLLGAGLVIGMLVLYVLARALVLKLPGVKSGQKQRHHQALQVTAFALVSIAVGVVMLIRLDLLDSWQAQLPADAPNYFAINIPATDGDQFNQYLADQGWSSNPLYPMLRGRLLQVNGKTLPTKQQLRDQGKDDESEPTSPGRELNLTESRVLGNDNALLKGEWWPKAGLLSGEVGLSLEQEFAQRIDAGLGDTLTFDIAGETIAGKVTSIRSVDWNSFNPNFFVIFSPGALADFPISLMTSFHARSANLEAITGLNQRWPGVTLVGVDALLDQLRELLNQLSKAVQYLFVFVLAAAWLVMIAVLQVSLNERRQEAALLHTLGVARQRLRQRQWGEFLWLGALAGVGGILGTLGLGSVIFSQVLNVTMPWPVWLLLWPPVCAVLVALPALWMLRKVGQEPPLEALRRYG
ncbi:ABC transporter permease [Pokkaliibacter sp. CJK22405]|uniref:ABC transporter permease n=1 Tax=Pokkaliibacter sp. CJK22405 TaxID=3384615 RepID=UPI0039847868